MRSPPALPYSRLPSEPRGRPSACARQLPRLRHIPGANRPPVTMNYADHRPALERDGFVVVRQFLSANEFQELTHHLDRYIREMVPQVPDSDAFFHDKRRPETLKQMQNFDRDTFLSGYANHARWMALANALLDEPVVAMGPEWFNKPPGVEHPTPPHQDNYYFKLDPPNVITGWLALDAVDEENGALRYVVGSHHHGLRPHATTPILGFSQGITDYGSGDTAREAVVVLDAGDLVVHHGETIHLADPNRSATRQRRAFAMVYRGVSARRDETAHLRHQTDLKRQHDSFGMAPKNV